MTRWIVRRTAGALLTLSLACLFTFVILYVLPGDAAYVVAGIDAPPEVVGEIRLQLGLDDPATHRFVRWVAAAIQGDLGVSLKYRQPVTELLGPSLTVNVRLAFWSVGVAMAIALPLGIVATMHHDRWIDRLLTGVAQIGLSIPSFWIGMLLIELLSVTFRWFPVASTGTSWRTMVMPIMSLAIPMTGFLLRTMRTHLVEGMTSPHVKTARAKGIGLWRMMTNHGVRNAAVSVYTASGLVFANVLTGSIIVETIFGLPGIGRVLIGAVQYRDIPLVMGGIVLMTGILVGLHWALDLLAMVADPRIHRSML